MFSLSKPTKTKENYKPFKTVLQDAVTFLGAGYKTAPFRNKRVGFFYSKNACDFIQGLMTEGDKKSVRMTEDDINPNGHQSPHIHTSYLKIDLTRDKNKQLVPEEETHIFIDEFKNFKDGKKSQKILPQLWKQMSPYLAEENIEGIIDISDKIIKDIDIMNGEKKES